MLKSYFKIAIRNLSRHRVFSFINITGLAIGIASALLIFIYVTNETSYDGFHKDSSNIFRVVHDFVNDDGSRTPDATSPAGLAPVMQREIPEVVSITRLYPNWGNIFLMKKDGKAIQEERFYRADSNFFDVFTFPFVAGNAKNALKDLKSVVLTESTAKKYFGNKNPIGKSLQTESFGNLIVTAVIKDIPSNSHFHFDFLAPFNLGNDFNSNLNSAYNYYTYVKTKPGTNQAVFERKIQDLYKRNVSQPISSFWVQPVKDIHLTSNLKWELEQNGDKLYVYIFSLIGVFILLIAAINYMNLTTAKASMRSREIGVRKVLGAFKKSLMTQFLVEAVVTCMFALLLALGLIELVLPAVNQLTGKDLGLFINPIILLYAFLGSVILSIVSGFFPALYLSSFKPVAVLKAFKLNERGVLGLRKSLVVLQFTISIALIIGAIVISQQMNYIRSGNPGLNTDQVVVINKSFGILHKEAFFNELVNTPGVKKVSYSGDVVGGMNSTLYMNVKGLDTKKQLVNYINIGNGYFDVLNMQMKEGRGFSEKFLADTMSQGRRSGPAEQTIGGIVLNETAAKELGVTFPAEGKQIVWGGDGNSKYYLNIIGIVKDFHFSSMHNKIKPFAFINVPRQQSGFTVKLSGQNTAATLNQLEKKWAALYPDIPFQYSFLDDTFAKLYESDARFQKVFISLVLLGILIACLGLFGLATFAAELRTKEIGVRKVLGASISSIVSLVSKEFLKLVLLSFIIASPIAWYAMNNWLQNFAYHITIHWWVFALGGLVSIIIASLTISFQSIKAATSNPVKSLRAE